MHSSCPKPGSLGKQKNRSSHVWVILLLLIKIVYKCVVRGSLKKRGGGVKISNWKKISKMIHKNFKARQAQFLGIQSPATGISTPPFRVIIVASYKRCRARSSPRSSRQSQAIIRDVNPFRLHTGSSAVDFWMESSELRIFEFNVYRSLRFNSNTAYGM